MVEVSLRELGQCLNVHRLLHSVEFPLERVVLLRFDEAEDPVSGFLVNRDLPHREHFRVDSWPVLLWHTQDLSLRVSNDFSL